MCEKARKKACGAAESRTRSARSADPADGAPSLRASRTATGLVIPLTGRSHVKFRSLVTSLIDGNCGHPARPSEHAVRPPLRPTRPLTVRGRVG